MSDEITLPLRLRTRAGEHRCKSCPPQHVCAWDCIQGAGVMDILYGAVLALEGVPSGAGEAGGEPTHAALWECYNTSVEPQGVYG